MIICVCHNVNSQTINDAIDDGAITIDAVREKTCAASQCGKCQFKINRLIHDRDQIQEQHACIASKAS